MAAQYDAAANFNLSSAPGKNSRFIAHERQTHIRYKDLARMLISRNRFNEDAPGVHPWMIKMYKERRDAVKNQVLSSVTQIGGT